VREEKKVRGVSESKGAIYSRLGKGRGRGGKKKGISCAAFRKDSFSLEEVFFERPPKRQERQRRRGILRRRKLSPTSLLLCVPAGRGIGAH